MIFKVTKWQNNSQTLYCLSDFHVVSQPHNFINNQQRAAIAQAAKSHNAIVIVEDALRYFDREPSHKQVYAAPYMRLMQLTPQQTSLLGLSSICYHAGINTHNIEFRLGPTAALNAGHATSKVLAHTQEALDRIAAYDDGSIANKWYKKIVDEYTQLCNGPAHSFLQQLHTKGDQHISRPLLESIPYSPDIQRALEQLNPAFDWNRMDQYSQKVILLMLFDNKLLDAELIHALMLRTAEKSIFICSGDDHIVRLQPVLEELGYTNTASEGDDLIPEDIRYQEPKAIPTNQLLSLLEAKKEKLPLLLRISLYIQSLLDRKNAHFWIGAILSSSLLAGMIGILSTLSLLGISTALWHRIVAGLLIAQATVWYLARPTKKKKNKN